MEPMQDRLGHEIEHGRFLAAQGAGDVWNWTSPAGRLRRARRVRMLCDGVGPGHRVLELGCGTGLFTRDFAATGAAITAVDISPELLAIARGQVGAANVTFVEGNAYAMTFPPGAFDRVVGSSVLHHLEVDRALRECFRVLRAGGEVAFTDPNMLNPQIAVQKNVPWIKKRMGDSPDETAFFRWRMRRQLAAAGFRDIRITPFDFLHPAIPGFAVGPAGALGDLLERIPLVREIAGSLYIRAVKPA